MADICPDTRLRCDHAEVCWLIYCGKLRVRDGVRYRPISERQLTKIERYALHMHKQRSPGTAG